jgi:hypothetical protein
VVAAFKEAQESNAGVYLTRTAEQEAELHRRFAPNEPDVFILTPGETEKYLETGELPERVERWLDSNDSRGDPGDA